MAELSTEVTIKKLKELSQDSHTNIPNGGFPPITICQKNDGNARREFSTKPTLIAISTLIKNKKSFYK